MSKNNEIIELKKALSKFTEEIKNIDKELSESVNQLEKSKERSGFVAKIDKAKSLYHSK